MRLTAEEVLSRAAARYAACTTYQDSGDHVSTLNPGERNQTRSSKPFKTWFVRPDLFRFEFRDRTWEPESSWVRHVVARADGRTQSFWSTENHDRAPESLRMALAGATGISGGTAHTIPCLLLTSEIGGRTLNETFHDAVVEGPDTIDSESCHHLVLRQDRNIHEAWIGVDSLLLRKLARDIWIDPQEQTRRLREDFSKREPSEFVTKMRKSLEEREAREKDREPFRSVSLTTYSPQFDHPIDPEVFRRPL